MRACKRSSLTWQPIQVIIQDERHAKLFPIVYVSLFQTLVRKDIVIIICATLQFHLDKKNHIWSFKEVSHSVCMNTFTKQLRLFYMLHPTFITLGHFCPAPLNSGNAFKTRNHITVSCPWPTTGIFLKKEVNVNWKHLLFNILTLSAQIW